MDIYMNKEQLKIRYKKLINTKIALEQQIDKTKVQLYQIEQELYQIEQEIKAIEPILGIKPYGNQSQYILS